MSNVARYVGDRPVMRLYEQCYRTTLRSTSPTGQSCDYMSNVIVQRYEVRRRPASHATIWATLSYNVTKYVADRPAKRLYEQRYCTTLRSTSATGQSCDYMSNVIVQRYEVRRRPASQATIWATLSYNVMKYVGDRPVLCDYISNVIVQRYEVRRRPASQATIWATLSYNVTKYVGDRPVMRLYEQRYRTTLRSTSATGQSCDYMSNVIVQRYEVRRRQASHATIWATLSYNVGDRPDMRLFAGDDELLVDTQFLDNTNKTLQQLVTQRSRYERTYRMLNVVNDATSLLKTSLLSTVASSVSIVSDYGHKTRL